MIWACIAGFGSFAAIFALIGVKTWHIDAETLATRLSGFSRFRRGGSVAVVACTICCTSIVAMLLYIAAAGETPSDGARVIGGAMVGVVLATFALVAFTAWFGRPRWALLPAVRNRRAWERVVLQSRRMD